MSKVVVPNTAQTPLPAPIPAVDEIGPLVGKHFGGYEVVSYIGEGPTGSVYRAEDAVGQKLAVKIMHRELSRKEPAEQLWNDLKKLGALGNPHFVQAYESGFGQEGEFFIVLDELVGSDLESALEESGALAPRRAVEIVSQICEALEKAHAAGVVHGGLKPRNVFLSPAPGGEVTVKVLDFGATQLAGGADKGVIVGNPFYMAPEQFGGVADERTDVYSLGVLMYELFSGTLPFSGPSHGQVMMRHLAEQPQPPPGVDAELSHVILRALAKAPAGRFPTVAKLHEAIDQWAKSTRALEDAAAVHVMARAAEARKMKQAALSTPDATAPMPKIDLADLAQATRQELAAPPHNKKRMGNGSMNDMSTRKDPNPNSPESVEASLEDFISQANASFPTTTSDGWDLHTGDVELIDDEGEENVEADEAPIVVKPRAKAEAAAHLIKRADNTARRLKASLEEPTPLPPPNAGETLLPPGARRRNPFEPVIALEDEMEAEPLGPPPTGPKRRAERTEVVSSPLPRVTPWTSSPLMWIGGVVAAFVLGAGLVFLMVRTMMPSQPIVVQAPPPVVVHEPAAAPTPSERPVVTPLAGAAKQPVVTPLEPPAAEEPAVAAPVVTVDKTAHAGKRHHAAKQVAVAAAPSPAKSAPAKVASAGHKSSKLSMPDEGDDDDSGPAAAPAKKAPKKEAKKGGDWVDPFAQ